MAELLIRIAHDARREREGGSNHLLAGDTVVVCPDGWPWSKNERDNPDWKIVKVEGSVADWKHLTDRVLDTTTKEITRLRRYMVDMPNLPDKAPLRAQELLDHQIEKV